MDTRLEFVGVEEKSVQGPLLVVGRKDRLLEDDVQAQLPASARALWSSMVEGLSPGDSGDGARAWVMEEEPVQVSVGMLPELCSRHNSPAQPHALTSLVRKHLAKKSDAQVLLVLDDASFALASACAVARAFPLYSRKSKKASQDEAPKTRTVRVKMLAPRNEEVSLEQARLAAQQVRFAARLVDMPTSELHTDAFVQEAEQVAERLGVSCKVLRGEALREGGFGGLWSVGRCATRGPALVVLSYEPPQEADQTLVWVGKGIVYDTGGLSIKTKTGMPGMKGDMGGAAGVLGAFAAAVQGGIQARLHAVLCLAENAVGADAFRPDDILEMYSGKTVEVNNTDAEGRLVLADGVAYAVKHLAPDVIVDMATLTGAQLVSTGRRHAAIVCNDDELEQAACEAGRYSGDLVHPLPYCPEFYRAEFKSEVADLKNSVKDRMNAQSSCAGQFIAEHLGDYAGTWLHVDIAGPSGDGERGTGFGIALMLALFARQN